MANTIVTEDTIELTETRCVMSERIKRDVRSTDLVWSLFYAALSSYRRDSVLRPYPPSFYSATENNEKDFISLEEAASTIPSFKQIFESEDQIGQTDEKGFQLLSWVVNNIGCDIKTLEKEQFHKIRALTGDTTRVTAPNHVFEVVPSASVEERFTALRGDRKLIYGFHGSRLENFYSILHNGLHYHLNKNSLFGQGIYLSSELSVCFLYSPTAQGWEKSMLGTNLSCIAVCEIIDHPDVKCHIKDPQANGVTRSRARANDTQAGDVPEKYYLVSNDSLVRVKYLLVFSNQEKVTRRSTRTVTSWLSKHKFLVMMSAYVIILAAIGLTNSRKFSYFLRKLFS